MNIYTIGVIGGTGPQGKGLAYRFARAGYRVVLGSRSVERAQQTAGALEQRLAYRIEVTGLENQAAAAAADVVVLAVPYEGQAELIASLRSALVGKIVVSCVNPLDFDKRGPFGLDVPKGSGAEQVQRLLPDATVIGAFHHLSAVGLWGDAELLHHDDVLVCGDDVAAKSVVMTLARAVTGRDGIDGGALRLARQLEPLTAVLISINKRYKTRSGVRISGLAQPTWGSSVTVDPVVAVIPIKQVEQAKSRLAVPHIVRRELAFAFAQDTFVAVAACTAVDAVVVVSDEPLMRRLLENDTSGVCRLLPDPRTGMVAAVRAGQLFAFEYLHARRVVVVPADLPALMPVALTEIVSVTRNHESAYVPDMTGQGTTLLLTGSPDVPYPQYGPGSARLHRRQGATSIWSASASARQDIDDLDDLGAALALGVGPATRRAVQRIHDRGARLGLS